MGTNSSSHALRKIFLDTNILLDIIDRNRECHIDAVMLLWYAEENFENVELIASLASFKDAYYVMARLTKDREKSRELIVRLMDTMIRPVDLLASYGALAMASEEPDFEDALIRVSAESEGASVLLSRDDEAFQGMSIPKITVSEFLKQENFTYTEVDF